MDEVNKMTNQRLKELLADLTPASEADAVQALQDEGVDRDTARELVAVALGGSDIEERGEQ